MNSDISYNLHDSNIKKTLLAKSSTSEKQVFLSMYGDWTYEYFAPTV